MEKNDERFEVCYTTATCCVAAIEETIENNKEALAIIGMIINIVSQDMDTTPWIMLNHMMTVELERCRANAESASEECEKDGTE